MNNKLVDCYIVEEERGKLTTEFNEKVNIDDLFEDKTFVLSITLKDNIELSFTSELGKYISKTERKTLIFRDKNGITTTLRGRVVITESDENGNKSEISNDVMDCLQESFKSDDGDEGENDLQVFVLDTELLKTVAKEWIK